MEAPQSYDHMDDFPGRFDNYEGVPGGMGGIPGGMGGMPGGMGGMPGGMGGMPGGMGGMPGGMGGMPGGMGGMPGGMGHGGPRRMGHSHHGGNEGYSQNFQNGQQVNNNQNFYSPSSWMGSTYGSIYEILMIIFLGGFIFNCLCGKTLNDKYAIAWYNANKQYFEERYEMIGLKKEEDQLDFKMPDNLPITKENPHVFKFYAANYRYVKWLLAVLEVS
jgi:hypothetical protein